MEAVIKIGGSLASQPSNLQKLCSRLVALAGEHELLIVPGGGRFADLVRQFDRTQRLNPTAAHLMALLAMDQYGILLSSIAPSAQTVKDLKAARQLQEKGLLPILLPSEIASRDKYLEHSWNVTSDSIAARVAGLIHSRVLILVKDVDGIFDFDPKRRSGAKIIEELRASELRSLNPSCTDAFLWRVLSKHGLECYLVNGHYPRRIEALLRRAATIRTRIRP
ncbi:MAG TPA: hypothetical protein VED24_01820 [Candidatus Acidoferrum sp.]|nr:hypothetical protein [Candidatus Acidoferrum sp.]